MVPAAERPGWLRLARLTCTVRRKVRLLETFGSPDELFAAADADPRWAEAANPAYLDDLRRRVRSAARLEVDRDEDRLDELGIDLVPWGHAAYPPRLATIDDPPALLHLRGRLPAPDQPAVAIVGTRRVNAYGGLVAETLGRELAELGIAVISGLAAGVDGAAHRGALRGGGYTAGVLGTGVDRVYPASHRELAAQVQIDGGLLSEFALGAQPQARHFPQRNRIISGLAQVIVVVQAPARSGALNTARYAGEQGRDIMAVPGQITDGRHDGCHALIRDGARLLRDVDDILEVLGVARDLTGARPMLRQETAPATPPADLAPAEQAVLGALGLSPLGLDDLLETVAFSTPEVQSALVTLEIAGLATRLPGGSYVRTT